tara:strand:+ start:11951 stop:13102 length:1152 start_codon:yes stop_codon:yes gene_type:complete
LEKNMNFEKDIKEKIKSDDSLFDFETPEIGKKLKGKIVQKDENGLILSVGLKNDAWLPANQLGENLQSVKTGEVLEVEIIKINKDKIIVSRKKVLEKRSIEMIKDSFENRRVLSGEIKHVVTNKNKQQVGMMVDLKGRFLFMPRSLYEKNPPRNLDVLIGRNIKFLVKELKENDAIVSRIDYLEEKRSKNFLQFVSQNPIGSTITTKIKRFLVQKNRPFAMILNSNNGVNLFLHRSEATWGEGNLKDSFKEGQELEVKIIKVDQEKMQIETSYNMTKENPWHSPELEKENWLNATIGNKTKTGLFVSLQNGIQGFVHETEMPQQFSKKKGERTKARIIRIDKDNQKLSLSLISKEESRKPRGETFGDKIEGGQTLSDLLKDFE